MIFADQESKLLYEYYAPERMKDIDLIISCGDLEPEYLTFFATLCHAPLLYVKGNHDTKYEYKPPEGCICIDDDIFVSGALKTILEASGDITVSATGTDGKDAVRLFRTYRPDVLLMDIRMKELSGLDASAEILKEFPDAKILLLTTFSDDEYIVRALKLGAKGYLLKQDYESLIPALFSGCKDRKCSPNDLLFFILFFAQFSFLRFSLMFQDFRINIKNDFFCQIGNMVTGTLQFAKHTG